MSRPPIVPDTSTAGIAVDPRTLERVIPESLRADGTVRKQLKVRPGFTPQEDVRKFRGTRQAQADASALPKGHIVGWAPPSAAQTVTVKVAQSQSARKNAKRKEKRKEKQDDEHLKKIADSWEDDEDVAPAEAAKKGGEDAAAAKKSDAKDATAKTEGEGTDALAEGLAKLEVS